MGTSGEASSVPAYKRMGVELEEGNASNSNSYGSLTISGEGKNVEIRTNNSFLHDNVD
jgi:cell division protein FtsZ